MEGHNRILAILYIISGALQILGMLLMSGLISAFIPFIMDRVDPEALWIIEWIVPLVRIIAMVVILFFSIPSILGGVALLNEKKWAMTLLLILGCFKLFSFPIGTAIGVYTIWVYSRNHKAMAQAK